MIKNGIEIFFQNLGDADSIFIRHWENDSPTHILIDGGYKKDYEQVKAFLLDRFKESNHYQIDHMVCSHCHDDHAGGLVELAQDTEMAIANAWVHDTRKPNLLQSVSMVLNAPAFSKEAKATEQRRHELIEAIKLNHPHTQILAPFAAENLRIGPLHILSPTRAFFKEQYAALDSDSSLQLLESMQLSKAAAVTEEEQKTKPLGGDTGPYNEVSTVLALEYASDIYLFTADAGCEALYDILQRYPTQLQNIKWMQIPHHGSRRNLNEELVDHFSPKRSFISCVGDLKHPSQKLINRLKEKGKVFSTHYSVGKTSWLRTKAGEVYEMSTTSATPLYEKNP